ncbi:exopolyphosphatase [Lactobacillus sp. Sy-1]|uniref:Ppx/GppA phosphatase family protein n=1 Tax=Lactobacillus sp. Sy-1 TaxID=2109645 RepID=UPI001C58DD1C|nr:exopolyphosphatase [Lactobacillus sp. Sy-1]MBW1604924.1 exopolyphosphatase [Lactobacillus sp. Sy-1]
MPVNTNFSAMIVMGAQNIYVQVIDLKHSQIVEDTRYDIDLGEDVFSERVVHSNTVNEIAIALKVIRDLLDEYQVGDYQFFATHAFHEAKNSEFVREQLEERSHFNIKWISQSQEALYRNLATNTYLKGFDQITQKNALLIDISSGSVELIAYKHGKFTSSRTLKLGPLRVYESMRDIKESEPNYFAILRDYVDSRLIDFVRFLPDIEKIENVILMGSSIAILKPLISGLHKTLRISTNEFNELYREIKASNDQMLVQKYDVDEGDVPQILPIMTMLHELFKNFDLKNMWVSDLKFIDGLSYDLISRTNGNGKNRVLKQQILISANNLAKQYQVEPKHQRFVSEFVLQLFDELKRLHGLGERERLLLEISAIVDDVGSFINNHDHYVHSEYIIKNSEIIGLSESELNMVAAISRYHSHKATSSALKHLNNMSIDRRMVIMKLAAILRIADALDASRKQKIKSIEIGTSDPTQVIVTATADQEIELEKLNFDRKGAFFESVFGVKPKLKGRLKL